MHSYSALRGDIVRGLHGTSPHTLVLVLELLPLVCLVEGVIEEGTALKSLNRRKNTKRVLIS